VVFVILRKHGVFFSVIFLRQHLLLVCRSRFHRVTFFDDFTVLQALEAEN